jgi:D-alanyl-lipoteichoic acid acyltransferase DltB (MBOAT superfamily)
MTGSAMDRATAWTFRAIAWTAVGWLVGWRGLLLMAVAALVTHGTALAVHASPRQTLAPRLLLFAAVGAHFLLFLAVLAPAGWSFVVPVGAGVFMCHAVSYLVDVERRVVAPRPHWAALLYLVQLPVFPVGPLSRFHEFKELIARADVSMGGFAYGVRRVVTGIVKVYLIAGPLGSAADRIFALRVTRLSTDAAWLGAVCVGLEIYFAVAGFSDIGIGVGRIVGLRYAENFRRPYTADSIREFWRRWNVTLITWLRDYLRLPIAGHDEATPFLYLVTVAGFVIVGLWHRATMFVLPWAVYFGAWLALEAIGFGAAMQRLPRVVRHAYVLLVVLFGWVLLRASAPGPLLGYVEAMFGFSVAPFGGAGVYLTPGFVTALVCAVVFAGPLVGNISRWRVSVDAATASLLMMLAATGVLVWRWCLPLLRVVLPGRLADSSTPRAPRP